jgi:hypothetical protein
MCIELSASSEVEKFISSLDKSIMDSVRISHHPNWNGICWNSIKDEKCYMAMMKFYSNPKVVPFRSEAASIGMKQRWLILKII